MFGSGMLTLLFVLLGLAVLMRETSLFLLTLVLLVAALLSRLWERHCLERIDYRRRFSQVRAQYGETVELEIEIVNRKLLPLSWLEIEDEFPRSFEPTGARVYLSHKAGRAIIPNLLALRPYERVRRRYTMPCLVRGEHLFGPVRLRSGDLFGFSTREETIELYDTFVVYPRVVPLVDLGLPARQPLGDLRTQSWLFEDPTRVAGVREYRPGDSLRRIHWAASAKTQRLQTRVYEATTEHKLEVFLNLNTDEDEWWSLRYDPDVLEFSIVTAASLAKWGLEQGYAVGLATNGIHRWVGGTVTIPAARDSGQLERLLVALGRLQPFTLGSIAEVLHREGRRLPFGSTVVVVTAGMERTLAAAARSLRTRGHSVVVVLTGREPTRVTVDGMTIRRVGPPDAWRTIAQLSSSRAPGPQPAESAPGPGKAR